MFTLLNRESLIYPPSAQPADLIQLFAVHPYAGTDRLRRSAQSVQDEVETEIICPCGCREFNITPNQPSFPKFEHAESTADVYECKKCGTVMEIAWRLALSMCVLKKGNVDI